LGGAVEPSTGLKDDFADENDFSIADSDSNGSDILTHVIISHIVADSVSMVEGFKSNEDGVRGHPSVSFPSLSSPYLPSPLLTSLSSSTLIPVNMYTPPLSVPPLDTKP
jgi:hypothetical protein